MGSADKYSVILFALTVRRPSDVQATAVLLFLILLALIGLIVKRHVEMKQRRRRRVVKRPKRGTDTEMLLKRRELPEVPIELVAGQ